MERPARLTKLQQIYKKETGCDPRYTLYGKKDGKGLTLYFPDYKVVGKKNFFLKITKIIHHLIVVDLLSHLNKRRIMLINKLRSSTFSWQGMWSIRSSSCLIKLEMCSISVQEKVDYLELFLRSSHKRIKKKFYFNTPVLRNAFTHFMETGEGEGIILETGKYISEYLQKHSRVMTRMFPEECTKKRRKRANPQINRE